MWLTERKYYYNLISDHNDDIPDLLHHKIYIEGILLTALFTSIVMGAAVVSWWSQSVPITTNNVGSNPAHGEGY